MADSAALYRVPARCAKCEERGSVSIEHVMQGAVVVLNWYSKVCNHEWPVTSAQGVDRRKRPTERRLMNRGDRRT